MKLHGKVIEARNLSGPEINAMFALMQEYYDDTDFSVFKKDLQEKDLCILLLDVNNLIRGFSTQKIMSLQVEHETIYGVFSGDTIIHKDYWGSLELFKLFAMRFVDYRQDGGQFYWFLISKGYKTYRMLPVFFREYYPNYRKKTPLYEQQIMHTFGRSKYLNEYDEESGVIIYRNIKDKLKSGVADITARELKDKDVVHFIKLNPEYFKGNDLVCITRLDRENLKPAIARLLLGK